MATKQSNLHLELKHYKHIESYLNVIAAKENLTLCSNTKEWFVVKGLLQVSTVYEEVMAELTQSVVVSKDDCDLSNGADCKMTTVRKHREGKSYSAPVRDVAGKSGTLYVTCYERILDKFYYFAIPRHAYSAIPKTGNIEIPFNLDGTPKRQTTKRQTYANWWDYECDSLVDMASKPGSGYFGTKYNTVNVTYSMNYILDLANKITA